METCAPAPVSARATARTDAAPAAGNQRMASGRLHPAFPLAPEVPLDRQGISTLHPRYFKPKLSLAQTALSREKVTTMKVSVLGGGPAGLYFAILMQQEWPRHDITVYERNRADDTFGFGVVFSDATLATFEKYDPESYRMITDRFAYWDDIEVRYKGTVHRIGGNGFCGCARRTLLMLLQERARALGVKLQFQTDISDLSAFADSDLIVAADGINSAVRERNRDHFRPTTDLRPNRFAWMGSTRPLDAFTFSFRETGHGVFIAHAYQYEAGRSTWIFETRADSFESAGLGVMDEMESARWLEQVFAEDLDGHALITNRSQWRRFPMIRCATSIMGKIVLLGDAKSTAHFSIGSGTKLAMEDAISLFESFRASRDVPTALQSFEAGRREEVERIQHAADVSLVWFEQVPRFWAMEPTQFVFGLMTRSKSITYDNLKLRAPEFVAETDAMFARQVRAAGVRRRRGKTRCRRCSSLSRCATWWVANRTVVSPMCMYSATDGMPDDWHMVHYGSRAIGGAGLMFTEMTDVSAVARMGSRTIVIAEHTDDAAKAAADVFFGMPAGIPESLTPFVYKLPFEMLSARIAEANGIDFFGFKNPLHQHVNFRQIFDSSQTPSATR